MKYFAHSTGIFKRTFFFPDACHHFSNEILALDFEDYPKLIVSASLPSHCVRAAASIVSYFSAYYQTLNCSKTKTSSNHFDVWTFSLFSSSSLVS